MKRRLIKWIESAIWRLEDWQRRLERSLSKPSDGPPYEVKVSFTRDAVDFSDEFIADLAGKKPDLQAWRKKIGEFEARQS